MALASMAYKVRVIAAKRRVAWHAHRRDMSRVGMAPSSRRLRLITDR